MILVNRRLTDKVALMKKLLAGLPFFLIAPMVPAHGPPDADLSISKTLQERLIGSWHDGVNIVTFHRHGKVTGAYKGEHYLGTYSIKGSHIDYRMNKTSNAGNAPGLWVCDADIRTLDDHDLVMTSPVWHATWRLRRGR